MWPSAPLKLLQMLVWISSSNILSCSFFQSGFIRDSIPQLQSSHPSRQKNVAPIYAGPRLHELQQHAWQLQLPGPQLYACSITTILVEAKLGSLKRTWLYPIREGTLVCMHAILYELVKHLISTRALSASQRQLQRYCLLPCRPAALRSCATLNVWSFIQCVWNGHQSGNNDFQSLHGWCCVYVCKFMCVHVYVCKFMCVHVYVCKLMCVHVCVCVYCATQTDWTQLLKWINLCNIYVSVIF